MSALCIAPPPMSTLCIALHPCVHAYCTPSLALCRWPYHLWREWLHSHRVYGLHQGLLHPPPLQVPPPTPTPPECRQGETEQSVLWDPTVSLVLPNRSIHAPGLQQTTPAGGLPNARSHGVRRRLPTAADVLAHVITDALAPTCLLPRSTAATELPCFWSALAGTACGCCHDKPSNWHWRQVMYSTIGTSRHLHCSVYLVTMESILSFCTHKDMVGMATMCLYCV